MSDLQPDSVISGIHAIMQIYKLANVKTDLNPDDANDRSSLVSTSRQGFGEIKETIVFVGQHL